MPRAENRCPFLSGHGALCVVSALFFLCEGLLRGELAAAICGAAFLAYALFALAAVLTGAFLFRHLEFSAEWIRPGTIRAQHGRLSLAQRASTLVCEAVCFCRYSSNPGLSASRTFTVLALLGDGQNLTDIPVPRRGVYYPAEQAIVIRDYARFFSLSVPYAAESGFRPLTVQPKPDRPSYPPVPDGQTGCARGKSTFRRSDELYESRPYSPGDDPRKINWKLFAHTGSLSLRQGELLPPPANELYLFFNTALPVRAKSAKKWRRNADTRYDGLVSRAAVMAENLLRQKKNLIVCTPAPEGQAVMTKISGGTPLSRTVLLDALAAPQPGDRGIDIASVAARLPDSATFLFFSLPDQPIDVPALQKQRSRLALYIGPQPERQPRDTLRAALKRLLYVDASSPARGTAPESRADIDAVISSLNEAGLHASKI